MNKRFILAIATIIVLGLSVAAFAYKQTASTYKTTMSCCTGDKCPMKTKNASAGETASCCKDCDCCTGDSCPMKAKGDVSATATKMDGAESCPMKNAAATHAIHTTTAGEAKSCDCSCCDHKKEN